MTTMADRRLLWKAVGSLSGVAAGSATRALLRATIVEAADRSWSGGDLVTAGTVAGLWPAMERDLETGLRAVGTREPSAHDVKAAVGDFRYARRLVSAAEYTDWMASRGLNAAEVRAVLSRRVAREQQDRDPRHGDGGSPQRPDLAALLAPEAICSGTLAHCARWLVDRVLCLADDPRQDVQAAAVDELLRREDALAATALIDDPRPDRRRRAELMLAADAAYESHVRALCSEQAIASCLRRHALDWLHFGLDELSCSSVAAAAEIAELLREGAATTRVAELAGVPVDARKLYLEEAPAAIQGHLGAAVVGGTIGPVKVDGRHRVWRVRTRSAPTSADPDSRTRAAHELVIDNLARRRAGKVRWHDRH